jgi:hypothetical protein
VILSVVSEIGEIGDSIPISLIANGIRCDARMGMREIGMLSPIVRVRIRAKRIFKTASFNVGIRECPREQFGTGQVQEVERDDL